MATARHTGAMTTGSGLEGSDQRPNVSAKQRRTARLLVAGQFVLIVALVVLPNGDAWPVSSGLRDLCAVGTWAGILLMIVAALSLRRGLTAAPLPNDHATLRTGGLYRLVRHPIYSGLLLFALSQVVASGSVLVAVVGLLLLVLIEGKARWEEQRLVERFPDYVAYARRTPRFVPWRGWPARDVPET